LEAQIFGESPVKATREGLFFAGQYYDAIRWVGDIISNVQKKIVIIDRYFNEKTLDLLCAKNQKAKVEVLAERVKPPLKVKAAEFNKQYGQLEIRLSSAFHDRFIIVDDTDFYHLGASIEDLGRRGFMFSRIEEPFIIRSFSEELAQEWKNAKVEIQP
jgi:tRNA uridine 5-carbamoylmethylation protein Kti12